MNKPILLLLLLSFTLPALAVLNIEVLGDKLTDNWAHEFMGTDLVREEIKEHAGQRVNVAIFDSGFEQDYITLTEEINVPRMRNGNRFMRANHGTAVANLFNGPLPYGTTDNLNLINLTAITYQSQYASAFQRFEKEGQYPRVISNSLGWRDPKTKALAETATSKNILWFLASGNSWPEPIIEHEISSAALLVGSYSPSGLTSYETQSDNRLLILAAANEELPSIDGKGEPFLFGATSGATPVVAATVTNLISILPSLNRKQVFKIIQSTAFASIENKLGNKHAPGLLNAYKAFKVSLRLRKLCPFNNENECIDKELEKESLYLFTSQLKTCDEFNSSQDRSDDDKLLKEMRRSALLGNRAQLQELECTYASLGFTKNAEFYRFLSSSRVDLHQMQKKAIQAINIGKFKISYYRYLSLYTPEILINIDESLTLKEHHKRNLRELYK